MKTDNHRAVEKLRTEISSLDIIAKGGLPKNRTTLISGTAGSGKTVFAVQFLAAGIERGEPGVFVTFEESATDIRENMRSFGWDLGAWEKEDRKSTRLNSSHLVISYAVFCLKTQKIS